jgi:hypothetical protein
MQLAAAHDPLHGHHILAIYWTQSDAHARRLKARVELMLADLRVALQHAWHNIEPQRVAELILWAADLEGIEVWDDAECERRCTELIEHALKAARRVGGRRF